MFVYSLTGRSGTGKSYQAMSLCNDLGIEAIIDDGLFIMDHQVEAGHSAKREGTKVGAIKAAVFAREDHRREVADRIRELKPEKILVLGTSDAMADKICEQLELPPVGERIHIEDITTGEERAIARRSRQGQGKHVIPVPSMQLKRDFAGYFMDPIRILKGIRGGAADGEKTVVRPTYSYMGDFIISDTVITDIAWCVAQEDPGILRLLHVFSNTSTESLHLTVDVILAAGPGFWDRAVHYQNALREQVEHMTAFNVVQVDIQVRGIEKRRGA